MTILQNRVLAAPQPNAETQAWWDAAGQERLMVPRCDACGRFHWYPRAICPHCFSDRVVLQPATGRGNVYSYTVFRREKVPYALAFVTLEEGITMMTNLVECDPEALSIGQAVTLTFQRTESGAAIPMFKPLS